MGSNQLDSYLSWLLGTGTRLSPALITKKKSLIFKIILIYLFFPIAIPIVIYKVIRNFREKFGLKKRPLEGKVVLITGASSGIGEALAQELYLAGCKLILSSRRLKELERVKSYLVTIETYGTVYVPATLQLDLENLNLIKQKSVAALAIYGHIDILINNAGISFRGDVLKTNIELDQKIMTINYFGPLSLTKNVAESMVKQKNGQIVFISSVQGKISIPHRSAYGASKHAIQALADCLRAELFSTGVDVIVVSPSYVQTNLSVNAWTDIGSQYGKIDSTTASGYSTSYIAERTVKALLREEKDIVISSLVPRIVILIRNIWPSMFFKLMSSRANTNS